MGVENDVSMKSTYVCEQNNHQIIAFYGRMVFNKRKCSSLLKQHLTFLWLFSQGYSWNSAELFC